MSSPHLCGCGKAYKRAEFVEFCSVDCREDHFSALGAGDTRFTTINQDQTFIGSS